MNKKEQTKIGRHISKLLRHDPEDLKISKDGYVKVTELCKKLNITKEELDIIVENNDKKRFEYKGHKEYIKARQGHSNDELEIELEELPVDYNFGKLYHGTCKKFNKSIISDGLKKMSRQYVHWTQDIKLADKRAKTIAKQNKSQEILYILDTKKWLNDDNKIYKSGNDVFLTDNVDFKYLSVVYLIPIKEISKEDQEKALCELVKKYSKKI